MTALTGIAPSACDSAVIPAQAGIQEPPVVQLPWTPAFAGVTVTVETESGNALAGRSPWLAASRWETARRSGRHVDANSRRLQPVTFHLPHYKRREPGSGPSVRGCRSPQAARCLRRR